MTDIRQTDEERFLIRLAIALEMPDDPTRELIEEVDGHLSDTRAALIADGADPDVARLEALARLGRPEDLARGLRQAHAPRRRLVTAIGPAIVTGIGSILAGYLFAVPVAILALAIAVPVSGLLGTVIPTGSALRTDWISGPMAIAVVTYAGHQVPRRFARASWRTVADVQLLVAMAGAIAIAALALFAIRTDLDAFAVATLALLPLAWAIGALTASDRPTHRLGPLRVTGALVLATSIAIIAMIVGGGPRDGGPLPDVAPPALLGPGGVAAAPVDGEVDASIPWWVEASATWETEGGLRSWTDIRAEVWRSGPRVNPVILDSQPVLTVPATVVDDSMYAYAKVTLPSATERAWYRVILTGVAADGARYSLASDAEPIVVEFRGTAWDWLTTR